MYKYLTYVIYVYKNLYDFKYTISRAKINLQSEVAFAGYFVSAFFASNHDSTRPSMLPQMECLSFGPFLIFFCFCEGSDSRKIFQTISKGDDEDLPKAFGGYR